MVKSGVKQAIHRACVATQVATPKPSGMSFAKKIKASRSIDMPMLSHEGKSERAIDGNTAAAHVAYAMSDVSFIYPISPSTSMGETMDKFATAGRKNVFGQTVKVRQMQSELGSAGALHGALSGGALCTTFTASQGLLLMIPNMYLCAGELLPAVFHVSARALARQSLSIFCDHSDVMAVRSTGCALLSAHNPQEVMDMGLVAHLASLKSSVPFVHFFDGTRTSGVIECVKPIPYSTMKSIVPWDELDAFRQRGLNPQHPMMRGLGQDPQVYYQSAVSANQYYDAVPHIVQDIMDQVAVITGRQYKLFEFYGDPEAERVVVLMGSAAKTAEETVDYLRQQGEKVGILKVHLFRPFSTEHFLRELPDTVKAIAVLDRTKEDLAPSLPLHADVLTAMSEAGVYKKVVGGNYGLGSKEFAPRHVKAVFDNLLNEVPKKHFTVGINDDVTHSSLPVGPTINTQDPEVTQAVFFGLGSDGTVGANKAAAAIIGERTEFYSQGHFNYSSQKAGASTVSHLRFGPKPIRSEYEIESSPGADYVACHHTSFLGKFDMLSKAREGAAFVVNCPWKTLEEVEQEFPAKLRRAIAEKKVELYTIDAHAVASGVGLPAKRINQVMQATFFNLSGILPPQDAKEQLEGAIDRMYGKKSPEIVRSNKAALAAAPDGLNRIEYPSSWLEAEDSAHSLRRLNPSASTYSPALDDFSGTFLKSIDSRTADDLAVSAFAPGGETPIGQSTHQKRALAEEVPVWLPDKCTQCNLCSVVCPHAVVRPFLLDKKEMEAAPEGFVARKAKGGDLAGLNYTIQLAPFDCTGCAVCVEMCPDDALVMETASHSQEKFNDHWEYSLNKVAVKDSLMERNSVKGSQFQEPLIEFSGACSGCGETPYVKLLTQMFGDRMVIANSSGCSSVWGGSYGLSPFKKNRHGQGPAWARSLFEDTAEYGLGMALGSQQRRERLVADVQELLDEVSNGATISSELQRLLERWIQVASDAEKCSALQGPLRALLAKETETSSSPGALAAVQRGSDLLVAPSHWIIGGDGWAYDIGFGGLDHVLACGQNINILVLDTEGYSNTGAQNSKATPKGATMKMSAGGNKAKKKDLGAIAMMHENAYVASVSLSADVNQTVKAFKEAEAYDGPSIIIAYATCVDWGHRAGDKAMVQQQVQAVESGYWPLYRYNPDKVQGEQNGFELDNKRISPDAMDALMRNENRFTSLQRSAPEYAAMLQNAMKDEFFARHEARKRRAMADEDLLEYLKKAMGEQVTGERVTVLYGTDTGNAEMVARNFQFEFKRRGMKAKCLSLNDMPISELQDEAKVLAVVSTAGQGEMPKSAVKFWQDMETFMETAPGDFLKDTKFAVFGLGDSSYVFFNEAAKRIDGAFERLGAQRVQGLGLGDDQHPGRFDAELEEWSPDFYDNIEAPEAPQEPSPPSHLVEILSADDPKAKELEAFVPAGSKPVRMTLKRSTVPEGYERAIDHFEFDLSGSGLSYEQGDSLGLWPSNPKKQVDLCLMALNMKGDEVMNLRPVDSNRSVPLPEVITARSLLTDVLDIAGWPKRRFYEMLKLSATDEQEKEQLQKLCSKEGKEEYQAYADESYTYAELLHKFPSCKVTIGHLLDYVPDIKPRLYSIASSSRMRGDDVCHLCIIKNDWQATSGRWLTGLSTRWLSEDLHPEAEGIALRACVHPSAVTLPEKHVTPMVMVALGTGIAPMRAFIEERAAAKKDGEQCGPMALFFGARNRQEYSYEAEFEQYQKDGVLEHIHLALSREQKEKIYVTHRLQQNKKLVYDLIHEKEGNLYLCGPGGNVPPQVRQAVIDAIKEGGHSAEYAEKYVQDMQINGRYNVEAW